MSFNLLISRFWAGLWLGLTVTVSQANEKPPAPRPPICPERVKIFSVPPYLKANGLPSCQEVDSNITPLSASYQPHLAGQLAKNEKRANAAVIGTQYVAGGGRVNPKLSAEEQNEQKKYLQETPLAHRLIHLLQVRKQFLEQNSKSTDRISRSIRYLQEEWLPAQAPGLKGASRSERELEKFSADGKCHVWARWAQDPKALEAFAAINQGLLCYGVPVSRGELKELAVALYGTDTQVAGTGTSNQEVVHTTGYVRPDQYVSLKSAGQKLSDEQYQERVREMVSTTMGYNVALNRLGLLGTYGSEQREHYLKPEQIFSKYAEALSQGRGMVIDRDQGFEVWNHPVYRMAETTYAEKGAVLDQEAEAFFSTADFAPLPGQEGAWQKLAKFEKAVILSINGDPTVPKLFDVDVDEFASGSPRLKKWLEEQRKKGNEYSKLSQVSNSPELLSEMLLEMRRELVESKKIKLNPSANGVQVVKRDLYFEMGNESTYAEDLTDEKGRAFEKTLKRSFRYSALLDPKGQVKRTRWSPKEASLEEFCSTKFSSESGREFFGFSAIDAEKVCQACQRDPAPCRHSRVMLDSPPPRTLTTIDRNPHFKHLNEEFAYQEFMTLLRDDCVPIDTP